MTDDIERLFGRRSDLPFSYPEIFRRALRNTPFGRRTRVRDYLKGNSHD